MGSGWNWEGATLGIDLSLEEKGLKGIWEVLVYYWYQEVSIPWWLKISHGSIAVPMARTQNIDKPIHFYNLTKNTKKDYAKPLLHLIFSSSLLTFKHTGKKSQKSSRISQESKI